MENTCTLKDIKNKINDGAKKTYVSTLFKFHIYAVRGHFSILLFNYPLSIYVGVFSEKFASRDQVERRQIPAEEVGFINFLAVQNDR